jgi:hypothetical protein
VLWLEMEEVSFGLKKLAVIILKVRYDLKNLEQF